MEGPAVETKEWILSDWLDIQSKYNNGSTTTGGAIEYYTM